MFYKGISGARRKKSKVKKAYQNGIVVLENILRAKAPQNSFFFLLNFEKITKICIFEVIFVIFIYLFYLLKNSSFVLLWQCAVC